MMKSPAQPDQLVLDKPGAGVPLYERLVVRLVIRPVHLLRFDWEQLLDRFAEESELIAGLVERNVEKGLHNRVLIPRLAGIEDSSRNWSVVMTIEHLLLTVTGMSKIADALLDQRKLDFKVDTALVKPEGKLDEWETRRVMDEFKGCCGAAGSLLRGRGPGRGSTTHAHPWFGEFRALDWVWLLFVHHRLHRRQIEKILQLSAA